jgi:protease I
MNWPFCSIWQAGQLAGYQACQEELYMSADLTSVKVATLVSGEPAGEDILKLADMLKAAGATVIPVTAGHDGSLKPSNGYGLAAGVSLKGADEAGFDALLLAGDRASVDQLAANPAALAFARAFVANEKPVGAVSYAIKILLVANALTKRRLTADSDLEPLVRKSGAEWADEPVVVDRDLVTVAEAGALDSFCEAFALRCFGQKSSSGSSLHTD